MSDEKKDNPLEQAMEVIIENGFAGMVQAISILVNEAMKVEYLIVDARYEKVRMNGSVVSSAVLIATGMAGVPCLAQALLSVRQRSAGEIF